MEMEGGSERAALGGRGACWWKLGEEGVAGLLEFERRPAMAVVVEGGQEGLRRGGKGVGRLSGTRGVRWTWRRGVGRPVVAGPKPRPRRPWRMMANNG